MYPCNVITILLKTAILAMYSVLSNEKPTTNLAFLVLARVNLL